MNIVDVGNGPPLVLVPGIQGRWEWMKPAVDALAQRCRVITFSLADERSSGGTFDPSRGFDSYVEQVRDALDQAQIREAAICGVSYGSLIAGAFGARYPERASALVLVSGIPPSWKPDSRVLFYLRSPRVLADLLAGRTRPWLRRRRILRQTRRAVVGWAGPWLLSERWWVAADDRPGLRAHLQVTFDDGRAVLLACTAGGWTCEATYD